MAQPLQKVTLVHPENTSEALGSGVNGDYPTDHIGHFLNKSTFSRMGDLADLPNTQKQTGNMRREENIFHTKKDKPPQNTK